MNIKEQLKMLPVGLRAFRAGKIPPVFHKARPGAENVKRIFEKVEKKQ
jgi:hypothetical protein